MNPFLPSGGGDVAATKPLVLCADDYAQSATISAAIRRLAAQGRLSATSAMVLSPHWPVEAAALRANGRGRIDVGLHLDWTSPFAIHAGHGMTLNRAMARAALGGFDRAQATAVIERQLDAFEAAWDAPPDHVDGHQHVQQFAGIREALVACLARRYGALARRPWLRVSRAPAAQRTLKSGVIAALGANALEKIATSAGLACARWLSGIYDFQGDEAAYAHHMAQWLATSDAGTVLMCHPGDADTVSEDPDPIAPARAREAHFLASDTFARQLAEQRVRLVRGSALYSAQA
ncbi:ChbG/HpnK family deacetylase [Ottowia oryzae]|uniref:ChbG/HpnK family deacetylase n=1 Tax=Ottowia oryzae TaxID=2109914 RepID=A0A2S0MD33_9BURK|nr:ChbG/HpnK family deacetylase [Ottowia oryzae]AVO33747.1 hypothetical protein C6570_05340 [Ottowia oryzae]